MESANADPKGSIWRSFNFKICSKSVLWYLFFRSSLFEILNMIPRRTPQIQIPRTFFPLNYCVPEKYFSIFVSLAKMVLFEFSKLVYCVDGWIGKWMDGWQYQLPGIHLVKGLGLSEYLTRRNCGGRHLSSSLFFLSAASLVHLLWQISVCFLQ